MSQDRTTSKYKNGLFRCHRVGTLEMTDGLKRTTRPALYICEIDKYCIT